MNTYDDPPITRASATAFEVPTLVPIGDAENVVMGLPWAGDDYVGFTPWPFEFKEDNDGVCIAPSFDRTNPGVMEKKASR